MKLATLASGAPDGRLVIVSRDLSRVVEARAAPTLQAALDDWRACEAALRAEAEALETGDAKNPQTFDPSALAAALPRAWQFLDASAFLAHNHILADAWGYARRTEQDAPLMYQGLSNHFYPSHGEVPFRSIADNIDFEAEFAVIVDETPLGVSPTEALDHVRLILVINDWSLRAFGPSEMRGGFGFLQAKPPCSMSALAATPDEFGAAWRGGRLCLPLHISRNDAPFGHPNGEAMSYDFGQLIAHAAATRDLCAGTVIGSGTVSNFNADEVGSGCIAERQALDTLAGRAPAPYLRFGERVRLDLKDAMGASILGPIDQRVVERKAPV
jgi:2-keto-4-pentenoate hydratase/2-oxohepta-3-ene-1,7-dioic acid hydratase in catechol pathway